MARPADVSVKGNATFQNRLAMSSETASAEASVLHFAAIAKCFIEARLLKMIQFRWRVSALYNGSQVVTIQAHEAFDICASLPLMMRLRPRTLELGFDHLRRIL